MSFRSINAWSLALHKHVWWISCTVSCSNLVFWLGKYFCFQSCGAMSLEFTRDTVEEEYFACHLFFPSSYSLASCPVLVARAEHDSQQSLCITHWYSTHHKWKIISAFNDKIFLFVYFLVKFCKASVIQFWFSMIFSSFTHSIFHHLKTWSIFICKQDIFIHSVIMFWKKNSKHLFENPVTKRLGNSAAGFEKLSYNPCPFLSK